MKIEITGGTVIGKHHFTKGKNSNDAYVIRKTPDATVAIVCDGCGGTQHAEVGAKIASEFLANNILNWVVDNDLTENDCQNKLAFTQMSLLSEIEYLAEAMSGNGERYNQVLSDYFLFTCFGFACNKKNAFFFSCGDGYIAINDVTTEIGPFPNNAPPYLVYNLLPSSIDYNLIQLNIQNFLPLSELNNFLIGTDGLDDILDFEELDMPDKKDKVGALSQFWTEDKYFKNEFSISRRLTLMAGGVPKFTTIDDENGLTISPAYVVKSGILGDDTTLVAGRITHDEEVI